MRIIALQSVFVFRPGKKIDSVKICKKCKFYEATNERCKLFGNLDVVTGKVEYNYASFERREGGECGPEAKYWNSNIDNIIVSDQLLLKN